MPQHFIDQDSEPEMIQVVAPCSMQAGYQFMAISNDGLQIPVTVPPGGVQEGQVFAVPHGSRVDLMNLYNNAASEVTPFFRNNAVVGREISERGRWKDGLFDCFRLGYFHPTLWNATLCPQILMAQVLTRVKLNWLGLTEDRTAQSAPDNMLNDDNDANQRRKTFFQVLWIVIAYWILSSLLAPSSAQWVQDYDTGRMIRLPVEKSPFVQSFLYNAVAWGFAVYTWIVLTRLRRVIRAWFEIPVQFPMLGAWEDVCVTFWCGCCSVAQMARQTANYEQQRAVCCSVNGLETAATYPSPLVTTV